MSELTKLRPTLLWRWFEKICNIPHPTYHEQALANDIIHWAIQNNLWVQQDQAGNILIKKPASQGYENSQSIILQAHLDMVPQKNEDNLHDFLKDPIHPYIENGWVKAKGTTLGADNGIGLASTLAVLEDQNLKLPEIEVLLTVSEETGMDGASKLEPNWFKSQWMINTDSEHDGEICIGCAGGMDGKINIPAQYTHNFFDTSFSIKLFGGKGGHSGIDINKERVNAIKIMSYILQKLAKKIEFTISTFISGSAHNAIPRQALVTVSIPSTQENNFYQTIQPILKTIKNQYLKSEPDLNFEIQAIHRQQQILTIESQNTLLDLLNTLPNGVMSMSQDIKGVVESSLNLSMIKIQPNHSNDIDLLIRSLTEAGKQWIQKQIESVCQHKKVNVVFLGDYPGWQPESSTLLKIAQNAFKKTNQKEAMISVIHAGLECGLIKSKYPELDIISIGPTILDAHSPTERVNIETVERYWKILIEILTSIP